MLIPRLSTLAVHCPKEHESDRVTFRASDGTEVFAGIRLTYCPKCQAFWPVRVSRDAPHPSSIRKYAPLIKSELEKLQVDPYNWPYVKEFIAKRETNIIERVRAKAGEIYGEMPDFRTIKRVLDFCAEAGEKASFIVDGVIRMVKENGRSYVLYPDPYGIDPPLVERRFSCPTCGKEYSADDMLVYESYYCPHCLTWLTYDGFDVKQTVPSSGYVNVEGVIVNKATGALLSNVPVAIKMKTCETDSQGYFRLDYIPYGTYQLKILINGQQLEITINADGSLRPLTLALAECYECGYLWIEDNVNREYECPKCNTRHLYEDSRFYKLKREEAFCYDFNRSWVWFWLLRCPNCNGETNLEFGTGRWICARCGLYVEPKNGYPFFRCILPCGHEGVYSIHYLMDDIPIKCWTCDLEVHLPFYIQQAWKNLDYTVFDLPAKIVVNRDYFVRNAWVVPAILGGLFFLGLVLFTSWKGKG